MNYFSIFKTQMEKTTPKYSVECLLYDCKPSDLKERTTHKINNMSELKYALDTHLKQILEEINDCCGLESHDWMVNEKIYEKMRAMKTQLKMKK
jgi:hypothetical protein